MYFLERPKLEDKPEEIFRKCLERYEDGTEKKERLKKCQPLVEKDLARYERSVKAGNRILPKPKLPDGMKAEELYVVYEEKVLKKGSAGRRRYYNKIVKPAKSRGCPFCGGTGTLTLDHYLPKSVYPTLCVLPDNLIPVCTDCNGRKGSKCAANGNGEPLHLYYDRPDRSARTEGDRITDIYLHVRLDDSFVAEYYVECPEKWTERFRRRVSEQMEIFGLYERFSGFAVIETTNLETSWRGAIQTQRELYLEDYGDTDVVPDEKRLFHKHIRTMLRTEENIDPNSWKAALYRAWSADLDRLMEWLKAKEAAKPTKQKRKRTGRKRMMA